MTGQGGMDEDGQGPMLMRKVFLRVLLPILLLEVLNFLDRVNISFAALQMNRELAMSPTQYGLGVTLFSIGYVLFQMPSIWALKRFGMRRWLFATVMVWGVVTVAMAFIASPVQFHVLRALLGLAEAGFAAGAVYYVTLFSPRKYRAGAVAATMLAVPVSVILGGPLSGWLMDHPQAGLPGWRWMFLIEGGPALAFAAAAPFWFSDSPERARWLSDQDRDWLRARMAAEAAESSGEAIASSRGVFLSPRVWIAGMLFFCLVNASNAIVFWLPQVIKPMMGAGSSDLAVGVVSTLPWIGIALGMLVIPRHSDRTGERTWHIAAPALAAAAGLTLAAYVPAGWALALLVVGGFGLGGAQATFWSVPARFLSPAAAASGIAFIALISALLAPVFPYWVGWLREQTGSFRTPILIVGVNLVLAAGLVFALRTPRPRSEAG
jgi:ACS family tartrate transporter-like MFS transporter